MAARAEPGGVRQNRLDRRVVGVLSQRAVAYLAVHMRMLAFAFYVHYIRMAAFASPMAGELDGVGGYFTNGGAAIVPVLAKLLGTTKWRTTRNTRNARTKSPAKRKRCPASFRELIQTHFLDANSERIRTVLRCDLEHSSSWSL